LKFELGNFALDADKHSAVVPANAGTHTLRRRDAESVSNPRGNNSPNHNHGGFGAFAGTTLG
jgi:hypothetical protein